MKKQKPGLCLGCWENFEWNQLFDFEKLILCKKCLKKAEKGGKSE